MGVQAFTSLMDIAADGWCVCWGRGGGLGIFTKAFFWGGRFGAVKHGGCSRSISFPPMPHLAQALSRDRLGCDSILYKARV